MSNRFFAETTIATDTYTLDGEQAHHLANVMRKSKGDEVTLFDGTGCEFRTQIDSISKRKVELQVLERVEVSRELGFPLVVAVALPKGDRQKFLVEKLVELGVTELVPLSTTRGVAESNDKVIFRLNRQVIEASKQCGRNKLMKIGTQLAVGELVSVFDAGEHHCYLADPYADVSMSCRDGGNQTRIVAVGPEGGFTDEESQTIRDANWQPVSIGSTILRIETAAIAAATLLGIGQQSAR